VIKLQNKILLIVVVILSFILVAVVRNKEDSNHSFSYPKEIKVKNENNEIETLDIEEYLVGVLAAEMPASFEEEALKAQAVASRTYAIYKINHNENKQYDILTDITNQSYITKEKMQEKWENDYEKYLTKITTAVNETEDEVMYYDDEVIEAFYFSMSNGKTENSATVFSEDLPYIKSVDSTWENEDINNFLVTTTFSKTEFCQKLSLADCNNITISNITKTEGNRVKEMTINNKNYSGTNLRNLLNLRSTDIEIAINDNDILITTKGYGHGVGMSQYGANMMAKNGYNYKEILNYYYNDITIK
jgi:stage II sporulation protein D